MGIDFKRIERVKGSRDIFFNKYYLVGKIRSRLIELFESYGYEGIELPIIEYSDLYLRKEGVSPAGSIE